MNVKCKKMRKAWAEKCAKQAEAWVVSEESVVNEPFTVPGLPKKPPSSTPSDIVGASTPASPVQAVPEAVSAAAAPRVLRRRRRSCLGEKGAAEATSASASEPCDDDDINDAMKVQIFV